MARDRRFWMGVVALLALTAASFGGSLQNDLTNWDDITNLAGNPHLVRFGVGELGWAWTTGLLGVYQPLGWILLGLQWRLFGGSAAAVHLVSLGIHALNALVLWRLLSELLARATPECGERCRVLGAWLGAAAFAVHPLRTEAVAWASCQPYLPSVLFFMLSTLAYLRARRAALPLFVVAVLFKSVAVSLPLFLILLDAYGLGRPQDVRPGPQARRVWREKLPYFVVMLATMGLALWAKREARSLWAIADGGLPGRMALSAYSFWFYLAKTIVPWPLGAYYFSPAPLSLGQPVFLGAFLAFVATAIVALVLCRHRRRSWLVAAGLGYLVLLAPNIGLVRIAETPTADRYSYLAMLPWMALVAGASCRIDLGVDRLKKALAAGLGLVVLAGLVVSSRRQTATWRNSISLWSHALAHGGQTSARVQDNLATGFAQAGLYHQALPHYLEAYRLDPKTWALASNLALALALEGRTAEAVPFFREAIALEPRNAALHSSLATALSRTGQLAEARRELKEAIALEPDHIEALVRLAALELDSGNQSEGRAHLARALALDPNHPAARSLQKALDSR